MDLKLNFEGRFTRGQIAHIAEVHPELGDKLAAAAYLSGATISNSAKRRTVSTEKRDNVSVADDTLFRIAKRKQAPTKGTNFRTGLDELIKQFGKEPFFYVNVKEVAYGMGVDVALASNLRNNGYIVRVR